MSDLDDALSSVPSHAHTQGESPAQARDELSYDGCGINGPDEYRTRVATFNGYENARKYGPLFASAPDMARALRALVAMEDGNLTDDQYEHAFDEVKALTRAALRKAGVL